MLRDDLFNAFREVPAIDVHSHLARDRMAARGPQDLLFYHMLLYVLRGAGCPETALWTGGHMHGNAPPYEAFFRYWPLIEGTGFGWILRTILRDLYNFDEPLEAGSLGRLEAAIAARTARPGWPAEVLAKGRIERVLSSATASPPPAGGPDDGIRCTVETAPTGGTRESVTWHERLAHLSKHAGPEVATVGDLRDVVAAFYERLDWSHRRALVAWISSEADFRPVPDARLDAILADARAGRDLEPDASRLLEAALVRAICLAIRGKTSVFQICYGVQFLPPPVVATRPVARAAPEFASGMGHLFGEFEDIHFNILNGYEIDEPIWCAMTQAYANVSLAGFWWETFYPAVMHQAVHRRLDMVPRARLMGFFSDGYCVDWIYGRLMTVRRVLANVCAERIERGFMTEAEALVTARQILFDTPRAVFLPDEAAQA